VATWADDGGGGVAEVLRYFLGCDLWHKQRCFGLVLVMATTTTTITLTPTTEAPYWTDDHGNKWAYVRAVMCYRCEATQLLHACLCLSNIPGVETKVTVSANGRPLSEVHAVSA
jgi:hypothetical protein